MMRVQQHARATLSCILLFAVAAISAMNISLTGSIPMESSPAGIVAHHGSYLILTQKALVLVHRESLALQAKVPLPDPMDLIILFGADLIFMSHCTADGSLHPMPHFALPVYLHRLSLDSHRITQSLYLAIQGHPTELSSVQVEDQLFVANSTHLFRVDIHSLRITGITIISQVGALRLPNPGGMVASNGTLFLLMDIPGDGTAQDMPRLLSIDISSLVVTSPPAFSTLRDLHGLLDVGDRLIAWGKKPRVFPHRYLASLTYEPSLDAKWSEFKLSEEGGCLYSRYHPPALIAGSIMYIASAPCRPDGSPNRLVRLLQQPRPHVVEWLELPNATEMVMQTDEHDGIPTALVVAWHQGTGLLLYRIHLKS
eukprot:NODE_1476_length_1518_cov_59.656229_g1334_i0.p1 GENE.NODE_1476_length_1518_cov_59.656229_g1334_i0~~NODE_1476_length_1518_cov_59.656229_g1334_i0.p1  ORF type:complete len:369 (+),score=50.14 NODE_1476_length_1518_cov_59.656229_g1334_i0:65-1171(+)